MHFLTIVMAKEHADIEQMLSPYEENMNVEVEIEECECVENGVPNPACPRCDGTGKVEYEFNPNGHWDWYEESQPDGRWADYIIPMSPGEVNEKSGEGWRGIPSAIVTPARGWVEEAWNKKNEETWAKEYWEAFDEAISEGFYPFVVDVHD